MLLLRVLALAVLTTGTAQAGKGPKAGPAASAAEIPALANLLEKAGWEPTPELSGVFQPGSLFRADGATHALMVRSCFDAEQAHDTYTSAEVVTQLQAGVRVKLGFGSVQGSGELVKKVKFGAPVHSTLERLAMTPTEDCTQMLTRLSAEEWERVYAVQEVLTAEIAEQTCGKLDASGRFIGIGSVEGELAMACKQESLEPVAVAYRVVPLSELVAASPAPSSQLVEVPSDCPLGPISSISVPAVSRLAINGVVYDVRGLEARTEMSNKLQQCGHTSAAAEFDAWRRARRTTNTACATLVGCYPFAIGIWSAIVAKKHKEEMVEALLTGKTVEGRRQLEKQAQKRKR